MLNETTKLECEVTRKKNCKHIIVKIINGKIYISAPMHTSNREIEKFVALKQAWIREQLEKTTNIFHDFLKKEKMLLFGKLYSLNFLHGTGKTIKITLEEETIRVVIPADATEEQIKKKFKQFLKQEAQGYFEACLLGLRTRQDVFPIIDTFLETWRIRFMKSAFGLCYAGRKEIVLNTELVLYDKKYVNYVILHELAHFYFQNHSKAFYETFEALEPNWRHYKKELNALHKQYGGWSYI